MHPRRRIREAIFQKLKTPSSDGVFPTSAEGRVFKSRLAPLDTDDDEDFPSILVYAREDDRDVNKDYGPDAEDSYVDSHLTVVVEALVRAVKSEVDDDLDEIAGQIEAALDDWEIPGFEGATLRLGATDIDVIAERTRKPVGAIGLCWHVRYSRPWRERAPGTRPDTVDIVINGGAPERLITQDRGIFNKPFRP